MEATTAHSHPQDASEEPVAGIVAGVLIAVCVALLLTGVVTGLGIMGTIGFCTIIPGLGGSLAGYVAQVARGQR